MIQMLVIRLSSLGDILLTQPVLEQLRQSGVDVDLMVKPEFVGLARMLPGPSRVLSDPSEWAASYQAVLDLHATWRARKLANRVKAGRVVHYSKHACSRRLLVRLWGRRMPWNAWLRLDPANTVTQWYAQAAAPWLKDASVPAGSPRLEIPEATQAAAQRVLKEANLGPQPAYAVMAPGATWPTKQWPLEQFIQTAGQLHTQAGLRTVFIGHAAERALCAAAVERLPGQAVNLAGKTDLPTLAALIQQSQIVVGNDSGPMHLGLAAGKPVVALFGPTVAEFGFMPQTPRARILSLPLPCRPCSLHGSRVCPLGHHRCLRDIPASAAVEAALSLLRPPATPKKRSHPRKSS